MELRTTRRSQTAITGMSTRSWYKPGRNLLGNRLPQPWMARSGEFTADQYSIVSTVSTI
jgi:hypothetical protein